MKKSSTGFFRWDGFGKPLVEFVKQERKIDPALAFWMLGWGFDATPKNVLERQSGGIIYIEVTPDTCCGCRICEMVCSLSHEGLCSPELSRIRVVNQPAKEIDIPIVCIQCGICAAKCPANAIGINKETQVYIVDAKRCVGCGVCAAVCPFGAISLPASTKYAIRCDLCGGEPACVKACPTGCLAVQEQEHVSSYQLPPEATRSHWASFIAEHLVEDSEVEHGKAT